MKCKKHLPDLTSAVGVCASCLRERLQDLLDAQAKAQPSLSAASDDYCLLGNPDPNPPPPPDFPQSVSPYVTRRKSDINRRRERMSNRTPQVDTGFSAACDGGTTKRKFRRFWIISSLFHTRSNKTEDSSRESCDPSSSASPPSTSWFSTILPPRLKIHGVGDRRRCRKSNQGASPAVTTKENSSGEIDGHDRSASGCSSESSPKRRHQQAARRSRLASAGKSFTSMALCLSPLVRASPNRHWNNQKGLARELGAGGAHHLSTAAVFCANRSRKLADFGRVAHNR